MAPHPSRRTVIGAFAGVGLLGLTGTLTACHPREIQLSPASPIPLPIPQLAPSHVEAGVRVFDLEAQNGTLDLVPGHRTATAGFATPGAPNGYLGPTLRAARGETVRVRFRNKLRAEELPSTGGSTADTTVHWHGMHLPPNMDGGPHQMVAPGQSWEPEWTINQPAATLWYHPHPHGSTQNQVNLGLAGLFIVDDPEAAPAGLPATYGVDDVPVIVQDKMIGEEGAFLLDQGNTAIGLMGRTLLVNGARSPYFEASTERVRLRLLNGSTARTYQFQLADAREFLMIASDGGLLAQPVPLTGIRLSPGERAEIVVSLTPGERLMLRAVKPDLGNVTDATIPGTELEFDVLELRAGSQLAASSPVPVKLADIPRLREEDAAEMRYFTLNAVLINGKRMDMSRVDDVVRVDTTELWEVRNTNPWPHNFHVHDVQFQVSSIDGATPPPELSGWKDTVFLEPQRRHRLLMRFTDYTSATVPYMYHCHLLLHEDEGMMGQFLVVGPGQTPSLTLPDAGGHGH